MIAAALASDASACVLYSTYLGGVLSRAEGGEEILERVIDELAAFAARDAGA